MKILPPVPDSAYRRFFDTVDLPLAISRAADGVFVDVNRSFLERFGWSRGEVIGKGGAEIGLFAQPARQRDFSDELARKGHLRGQELDLRRKDGRILHCLYSVELVETAEGKLLLASMADVSERVRFCAELEAERQRMKAFIDTAGVGTWEWNIQTGACAFNDLWASMVGARLKDLLPCSIETSTRLTHPDDLAESGRLLQRHFTGESPEYVFEGRVRHRDGHWIWVLDSGVVVERDALGHPLLMIGTRLDISERKALEERLHELSIRDELTGLYNRRYVFSRLDQLASEFVRKRREFCVSIIDLDRFKELNEAHGHLAGDAALGRFGEVLASQVRPYDLVGRYGGEEFIVVSVNADRKGTSAMISRLLDVVRGTSFDFGGQSLRLTFSCGLASSADCRPGEFSVEAMVDAADRRLYRAKQEGRDRVVED